MLRVINSIMQPFFSFFSVFSVLKDKSFSSLVVTQFLGAFNDNLFKQLLVLFFLTTAISNEQGKEYNSLAGALFPLPFILFSLNAGMLADRFSKRTICIICKWLEVAVMLSAMLAFYLQNNYFLLGTLFFMGSQSALFGPSKYGLIPEMLPEKNMSRGNGVIMLTTFLAIIVGTAAAGALKEEFGSSSLAAEDIKKPAAFLTALQSSNKVSQHLREQLSPEIQKKVTDWQANSQKPEWFPALVKDLNRVLHEKKFYDQAVFADVSLRKKTQEYLAQEPEGQGRIFFNRLLIEDAYGKSLIARGQSLHLACLFFVAIALIGTFTSYGIEKIPAAAPQTKIENPLIGLKHNMEVISNTSHLMAAILGNTFLWFTGGVIMLAINEYGIQLLHLSETQTSMVLAILSIGIAGGSILAASLSGDLINLRLIPVGSCMVAATLGVIYWLPNWLNIGWAEQSTFNMLVLAGVMVGTGIFFALAVVPVQAYIQEAAPNDKKGRVLCTNNLFTFVGIFLSSGFYNLNAVQLGLAANQTIGVLALFTVVFGIWCHFIFPHHYTKEETSSENAC